jgi:hypothetical protein
LRACCCCRSNEPPAARTARRPPTTCRCMPQCTTCYCAVYANLHIIFLGGGRRWMPGLLAGSWRLSPTRAAPCSTLLANTANQEGVTSWPSPSLETIRRSSRLLSSSAPSWCR